MKDFREKISHVDGIEGLNELIKTLGYKTSPQLLSVSQFDLPESAQRLLNELWLLSNYEGRFGIYFGLLPSLRRTDFRFILELFYRRYPQSNHLFIFTKDWEQIAFVSPQRVAIERGKTKLLLRILQIDRDNIYHTDLEVLENISLSLQEQVPDIIWEKHLKAFNVERVTKDFFEAYKNALGFIKGILSSQNKAEYQKVHSFAQQLLSRIMFLYFVQRKGWFKWQEDLRQDKRYIKTLWEKYKKLKNKENTFYSVWLSSLFFKAFHGPAKHTYIRNDPYLPETVKNSFCLMPFLNGGLFAENELDKINFEVSDEVFELLFDIDPLDKKKGFLERYNFTIREDTPLEVEVAVDPEMLGKVYESLISEEERGKAGIFYTPRIEIDYMCKLSLVEYLYGATKILKEKIIKLVFEPSDEGHLLNDEIRLIQKALDEVKIVDPAVGSASFLVGMMNVLSELHRCIYKRFGQGINEFDLKTNIIRENLYGVDVKDWAVMVGELRLWLSLIIETEEKELIERMTSIYQHPLLPNLSFKMHQGDSLVEEIAGVPLSLRGRFGYIAESMKKKITDLVSMKASYFGTRSADLSEKQGIEELEHGLFKDIIENDIQRLNRKIKGLKVEIGQRQMRLIKIPEQKRLFEKEVEETKAKIQVLEKERQKFQEILENLKSTKDYFLWEIDFAEVFAEKGGFDIVIGNPPYVRQEKIAFPLQREEDYSPEEWRKRKHLYKEKLANSVRVHWGNSVKIDKKSDLYVYFYYHGLALLRPGGIFCFINSNSWLDVGYGAPLQEFLLKQMELVYVIDNQIKRSFKESDVNTVIVAIKRPEEKKDNIVKFVTYKRPFEEVLNPSNLIDIEKSLEIKRTEDFRVFPITKKELLKDGVELPEEEKMFKEPERLPYVGSKWGGKYLRAPDIFFKILEKGKGKLVRLGDIAEVRFGIKTGANEFFYLEPTGRPAPKGLMHVRNRAGWEGFLEEEFLKPVITKFENILEIKINPDKYIFLYPEIDFHRSGFKANDYIKWGIHLKTKGRQKQEEGIPLPQIQSFKGRKFWYSIKFTEDLKSKLFWQKRIGERFAVFFSERETFVDQKLYPLKITNNDVLEKSFLISLNSIVQRLLIEAESVHYTGAYTLIELSVEDAKKVRIVDPRLIKPDISYELSRKKFQSVFQEFGLPKPNRDYSNIDPNDVSLDKVMPDRRELDRIIFDALGLTEEEQLGIYRAVVELVKNRLVKARSI